MEQSYKTTIVVINLNELNIKWTKRLGKRRDKYVYKISMTNKSQVLMTA